MTERRTLVAPIALLLVLCASASLATSYVYISDEDLARQTPLIVEASVLEVTPSPANGAPSTDYIVLVERVLKGQVAGTSIVVRVRGGVGPDGRGLRVWGAPRMSKNERAILFLNPAGDGTYGIQHLMLGAFYQVRRGSHRFAVRDFSNTIQLPGDGGLVEEPLRDYEGFATWLSGQASPPSDSSVAPEDYRVDPRSAGLSSAPQAHTFIRVDGKRLRWFEFDAGLTVRWKIHQAGWDGAGSGGRDFRDAMAAWNDDPDTNINLVLTGKTSASAGFDDFDDINTLLFNDPSDEASPGAFSCASGGTVAVGGPWFVPSITRQFGSRTHVVILGADIVTNDGTACLFSQNREVRAETIAHELGHTLGLSHSCGDSSSPSCVGRLLLDDALMRADLHDDGRGARLGDDDRAAIAKLYSGSGAPTGGGGGPTFGLAAPTRFRSTIVNSTSIRLRWRDNSDAEDEYRLQIDSGSGFRLIGTLPADTILVDVTGLSANTTYRFRVRARSASDRSAYSDEIEVTTSP